jgi:DNA (cytosine-5)-methyltransferase 1
MTTPRDTGEPSVASLGSKPLTFGSLFAGIGGFDLGMERAGMQCEWQVEKDVYASSVLEKHWPDVRRWREVETFPPPDGTNWKVDVITAGVPCQPISQAGKQRGASDERWMWGECLRVVADLCPRFFVAENPASILSHDRGRTFGGILGAMAAIGYDAEWHVISASDVGAPHRRERVFAVFWRNWEEVFEVEDFDECRCCGDTYCHRCNEHAGICACLTLGKADDFELVDQEWGTVAYANGERGQVQHRRPFAAVKVPKRFGYWKTEPGVSRVVDGVPSRLDRLRCLGNAVVPQIVEVIGRAIVTGARA